MKTFSEKIKEAREELKLNQQQLGELVGVSKRSIAAYETTDTKPRGNIARKLAAALQVSVDYLLNDEIWTFLLCFPFDHARLDACFVGFFGFGQDDAMAVLC